MTDNEKFEELAIGKKRLSINDFDFWEKVRALQFNEVKQ